MEDIDPLNKYRPTALPFVNPVEKYEKQQLEKAESKKLKKDSSNSTQEPAPVVKREPEEGKGKEKMDIEDEENEEDQELPDVSSEKAEEIQTRKKTAADFFMKEELPDDTFLFLQLPSSLPTSLEAQMIAVKKEGGTNISGLEEKPFESHLSSIPDGYMGKVVIYKSGKVKLRLGDALFDIIPGAECAFRQEAAIISAEQKKCVFLGDLTKRLICSPDIQDLLKKADNQGT